MQTSFTAAVLAGGLGERLQKHGKKALIAIQGRPLLERAVSGLRQAGAGTVWVALNESLKTQALDTVPALSSSGVESFFVDTPSSLHTLWEVIRKLPEGRGHLMVTTVDTIVRSKDLADFVTYCRRLQWFESAVMTTAFIDDEKPLYAIEGGSHRILGFSNEPAESNSVITSGIYCFSLEQRHLLETCMETGVQRLRNFLTRAVDNGHAYYSFRVEKTLDVDREEDIRAAQEFLL